MTQRTTHSRRRLIVVGMASAAALILAGCAPSGAEPAASDSSPAAASQSFKVGLLASTTGFAASMGKDLQQGWDLYWSQHDNKSGNFTLSAVFEDDASDPQTALTKAKKLVTEDKVDVVVGPVLANNSLAVADYLNQQKVANLSQTSADDVTQRKSSPVVLRTGAMGGSQTTFAAGQWAWDEGHKTASTLCPDYAFGWDSCAGFVSSFTAAGGTISKQLWYPNGTTDMSTYVAQLEECGRRCPLRRHHGRYRCHRLPEVRLGLRLVEVLPGDHRLLHPGYGHPGQPRRHDPGRLLVLVLR